MRYIILLTLFIQLVFSVEVSLDKPIVAPPKEIDIKKEHYFGEELFQGHFKGNKQFQHNDAYIINVNDLLSVKMWGSYSYEDNNITVDQQGNIFIPEVGAIHVLGTPLGKLQSTIATHVHRVFNNNVQVYADVKAYQHISVFVSGAVNRVGLYTGLSTDSILQFIDKAGGVKHAVGSYRHVDVLRNNGVIEQLDLYDFLVSGDLNRFQFKNGDVILVKPIENFISVKGEVSRPYIFELLSSRTTVKEVMKYVLPKSTTNSFIVTKWRNNQQTQQEFTIEKANTVFVEKGDQLRFFSNYYTNSVTIEMEGEHTGIRHINITKGTTLYDVLSQAKFTPLSDIKSIHLYRKSIATIQKNLIAIKLQDLESKVLTNESSSTEEAQIRNQESAMVLEFIKRAKAIKQKGQIVLQEGDNLNNIMLEEGDRIVIPKRSNVVVVQGEVSLPNALNYRDGMSVDEYVALSGGYTDQANTDKILLIKGNGRVLQYDSGLFSRGELVNAGDSILVLKKVETKNMLLLKDITQILYQIAVGAAVALKF